MRAAHEILIVSAMLAGAELIWFESYADQAGVDAGVNYAKTLVNGVQAVTGSTNINTIPGYGGTNLPQANYYNNQDLNGLQTDAVVDLGTGAANEASLYAYSKAAQPKLQFGNNDPILSNSAAVSTNAMLNPNVLTVKTGNCAVVPVAGTETRIETCTSWMTPTTHVCNNTLNVNVTWTNVSSCPVGTGFSQVQALHNSSGVDDYVYARAYCNPGSGDALVDLQVHASDGDPNDCTGWTNITVSTNQATEVYTGALLRPAFASSGCQYVPVFAQGSCSGTNCNYTLKYYQLGVWSYEDAGSTCNGTIGTYDLAALGYSGGPSGSINNDPWDQDYGLYCVSKSTSVNLVFEKPNITQTPTVTETWNNGCGFLEAQVQ